MSPFDEEPLPPPAEAGLPNPAPTDDAEPWPAFLPELGSDANPAAPEPGLEASFEPEEEAASVFGTTPALPGAEVLTGVALAAGGLAAAFAPTVAPPSVAAASAESVPVAATTKRRRNPTPANPAMLLLTWASIATLAALWLWLTRPPNPTGLEDLVDDGKLQGNISPVAPVAASQTIPLGQTRRIGWLEITPLGIEFRKQPVRSAGRVEWEPKTLALRLRIANLGPRPLHPTDPAYQTLANKGAGRKGRGITDQKTGKLLFENGFTYSFIHPAAAPADIRARVLPLNALLPETEQVAGQEHPLLAPKEAREVFVASEDNPLGRVDGPMLWRVKLRKALTVAGKGAATVIAVPFGRADIVMKVADNAVKLSDG